MIVSKNELILNKRPQMHTNISRDLYVYAHQHPGCNYDLAQPPSEPWEIVVEPY